MLIAFAALFLLLFAAPVMAGILRLLRPAAAWSDRVSALVTVTALASGSAATIGVWFSGIPLTLDATRFSPFIFQLSVDRLGGFFLFLVCAVSIPAVVYSLPYTRNHYGNARRTWYWVLLPLFLLSMVLVVAASSVFAFFLGWELMTLLSTALIVMEGDSDERRRSIFIY